MIDRGADRLQEKNHILFQWTAACLANLTESVILRYSIETMILRIEAYNHVEL
jgi:hypothetical protein